MAKVPLAKMTVDALLELRDEIGSVLSRKGRELTDQLSRLGREISNPKKRRGSSLKGRKASIKYRDKSGNTWAGRGAQPIWLRDKLKAGAKLDDFAVRPSGASRKKAKKRRTTKR
jgi:DNA-binding protein H-NS